MVNYLKYTSDRYIEIFLPLVKFDVPFFTTVEFYLTGTGRDPNLNYIFSKSIANVCNFEINRILEVYKGFEEVSTLVDVGGCTAQNPHMMIISEYSTIKGINFDFFPAGIYDA